jgi:drug/metabolite transporter (DMT)-like permease
MSSCRWGRRSGDSRRGGSAFQLFELGILAAPLRFAIYTILVRRRPVCSGPIAAVGAMLMGSVMSLPVSSWVASTAHMPGAQHWPASSGSPSSPTRRRHPAGTPRSAGRPA